MDPKIILVIVIVLVLVVGVNGFLFFSLRRPSGRVHPYGRYFDLWRKATRRARNPWEKEENDLKELSKAVEPFKKTDK